MARWKKAPSGILTPHFSWVEAACRHCGRIPNEVTVKDTAWVMEEVRHQLGDRVMHVTSWCRCPEHNAAVGGATQSYHMQGMALDFVLRGLAVQETWERCRVLQERGLIGGLGHYSTWVHADTGPKRSWEGP